MAKGGGGSGPTIAKAYVAIIPTTKDAQKNISKELIPAMSDAGKSGGEAVSGGIASSLKAGASKIATIAKAAIAGAGVAAVTKFVHDSVGAFSDFEQLSGGVQKIFDEIDTSQILADAKDAYNSLGMSANQYLEAMTGVGATFASTLGDAKGYEVAKEGLQAISDFASGTGKNVDLLTEKYTLITRATSSYQSIADQFSGILPATSDAFLKQAQDAGLLGEQYEKLTDVPLAEYQEAVTKMLTRGVDAMGLLGNTATEATTTLAGSSEAMRGAWQNMLVAFGTGDMPEINSAMEKMGEALLAYMRNLVPRIGTILMDIVQVLPSIGQKIIEAVPDLVMQFAQAFDSYLSQFGIGSNLAGALSGAMTQISDTVSQVMEAIPMDAIMSFISDLIAGITLIGEDIQSIIVDVVMNILWPIIQNLWSFIQDTIMPGLSKLWPPLHDALYLVGDIIITIVDWIAKIVDMISNVLSPVIDALFALMRPIWEAVINAFTQIFSTAVDVIGKIWNSVKPFVDDVLRVVGAIFSAAGDWLKAHQKEINAVMTFIGNVVGTLISWASKSVSDLINNIGRIISGVVDVVRNIFNLVVGVVTGDTDLIWNSINGLIAGIGNVFWGVVDLITSPFRQAFDNIKGLWNSTIGGMGFTIPDWVPGVGGGSFRIPYMASGGTITAAGTVLVGEQGPELLDLPSGARVRPLSAADMATSETTSYSVMVGDVNLSDDDEVRRITRAYLEQLARLASPGGLVMA